MVALLAAVPQAGRTLRAVLWMMGRPLPEVLRVPRVGPPRPRKPHPSRAIVIPDFKYIEQPYKSHYPRSVWPSHADLKRVARQMVRDARRKTSRQVSRPNSARVFRYGVVIDTMAALRLG